MPRPLDKTIAGLKLRTDSQDGALTFTWKRRKYVLPFEARAIGNGEHVFIHLPPDAGLFAISEEGLVPVEEAVQAEAVAKTLRRRRSSSGKPSEMELPKEIVDVLENLPEGTKIVYDVDGRPRLARRRRRRKNGA